ncbi:GYDIA family GHMP kinase [Bernardetia sp.]|uniref:GYDIA family GHMP kinase n=1 Tax=Bernardetia sp. TaxID=1937974 RepID=UPI0025BFE443|nr:GYDIA family GHMP kinase [Bernardetia sp.]
MNRFHGNGKLLLSGEYYVLDGAMALAVPTQKGQLLQVSYAPSEHRVLHWKSYDSNGQIWFEARFDIETFEALEGYVSQKSLVLQKILQTTRKISKNFLVGKEYVLVETFLEFPRLWGLGSSSTLIHNIAKWAGINAFDLLAKTMGGSGYDVACAESETPILYERQDGIPRSISVDFNPPFKENLYFVYLGKKQSSAEGISYYEKLKSKKDKLVKELSGITQKIVNSKTLEEFEELISQHEEIIAKNMAMQRVKELYFSDYWGEIKSLGAWGGDFVLATSRKSKEETQNYFLEKGMDTFLTYDEMVKG